MRTATVSEKIAAIGFYIGVGPIIRLVNRSEFGNRFLEHHYRCALIVTFLIFCFLLAKFAALFVPVVTLRTFGELSMESSRWIPLSSAIRILGLFLLALWSYAVINVLSGQMLHADMLQRLAKIRILRALSVWTTLIICVMSGLVLALHVWSKHVIGKEISRAKIFIYYDDTAIGSRSAISIAALPLALTSNELWGTGSTVLLPCSDENIGQGMSKGALLVFATHGNHFGLLAANRCIEPSNLSKFECGVNLELVYLAGCQAGNRESEWGRVFSPARIISFRRETYLVEHVEWLARDAPRMVASWSGERSSPTDAVLATR